ncbi:MAG: helix-turn-helix domain-containing protein, partial [Actinomycetota bacterium]
MPKAVDTTVSLHEAARRLKVHYMTAYRYVRSGRLPARQQNGEWQVLLADVQQFAESRKK